MPPIPPALAAGIASAAITAASNIAISERQRKTNEAYQDKMNEYNTPEQQINRLKEAGISPNAYMTGNGTFSQGNLSAGVNPYQVPNLGDPFAQAASSFLTFSQGNTEDKMLSVRVAEAQANIENLMASAKNLGLSSDYQSIINSYSAALQEAALLESTARTKESYYNIAVSRQVARKYQYEIDNILPEELQKTVSERKINTLRLDEILALIDNHKADTQLKGAQTEEAISASDRNVAQTALTEQQEVGQVIDNKNAQAIAQAVLSQYKAAIEEIQAKTKLTREEAESLVLREIINAPNTSFNFKMRQNAMEKLGNSQGIRNSYE